MNGPYLKNIAPERALELTKLVEYQPGQIVSRTLAQNKAVSITLFSFDKGEEISAHSSDGDAMLTVLNGTARVTVGGSPMCCSRVRRSSCRPESRTRWRQKARLRCS